MWGIGKLSARQVNIFPLSSRPGTNVIVEMVALPSSLTLSRTLLLSLSGPSHQEICAAGLEPIVRHWNSALEPAESTIAVGFKVEDEAAFADVLDEAVVGVDLVNIFTSNGRTETKKNKKR